jgi:sugar phosphate isomerase/epimerase
MPLQESNPRMKISVALGALTFYPLRAGLRVAGASGADGVELLLDNALLRRGPERTSALADAAGLPVLSVHAPLRWMRNDLARQVADAETVIRFAGGLPGPPHVILHHPGAEHTSDGGLQRWLAAVDAARRPFAADGLRVSIENRPENHDGAAPSPLDDPLTLRSVAAEWGLDITFDIAHAASRNVGVIKALDALLPRVVNIHLSDALPERAYSGGLLNGLLRDHHLPGVGELPLPAVFDLLERRGYRELLTIELSPLSLHAWYPPSARRRVAASVSETRQLMAMASARVRRSRPSVG